MATETGSSLEESIDESDMELGRRVFAAVISHQQGITIGYAYNTLAKGKNVSSFWVDAGKALARQSMENVVAALGLKPGPR
jgi:hypothetical protein